MDVSGLHQADIPRNVTFQDLKKKHIAQVQSFLLIFLGTKGFYKVLDLGVGILKPCVAMRKFRQK